MFPQRNKNTPLFLKANLPNNRKKLHLTKHNYTVKRRVIHQISQSINQSINQSIVTALRWRNQWDQLSNQSINHLIAWPEAQTAANQSAPEVLKRATQWPLFLKKKYTKKKCSQNSVGEKGVHKWETALLERRTQRSTAPRAVCMQIHSYLQWTGAQTTKTVLIRMNRKSTEIHPFFSTIRAQVNMSGGIKRKDQENRGCGRSGPKNGASSKSGVYGEKQKNLPNAKTGKSQTSAELFSFSCGTVAPTASERKEGKLTKRDARDRARRARLEMRLGWWLTRTCIKRTAAAAFALDCLPEPVSVLCLIDPPPQTAGKAASDWVKRERETEKRGDLAWALVLYETITSLYANINFEACRPRILPAPASTIQIHMHAVPHPLTGCYQRRQKSVPFGGVNVLYDIRYINSFIDRETRENRIVFSYQWELANDSKWFFDWTVATRGVRLYV